MRRTDAIMGIQASKEASSYAVPALLLVRKVFPSPGPGIPKVMREAKGHSAAKSDMQLHALHAIRRWWSLVQLVEVHLAPSVPMPCCPSVRNHPDDMTRSTLLSFTLAHHPHVRDHDDIMTIALS